MGSLRTWGDISMVATSLIVISSARPETSVQLACNTVMNSLFFCLKLAKDFCGQYSIRRLWLNPSCYEK
jgi:hypothetical protein